MYGVVKFAPGQDGVELRELPEPVPRDGELKVKVLAAGICVSDIHAIRDERAVNMPVVLGHEYVGQVTQACGDTGEFRPGDYVLTLPACYSCGTCGLCAQGLVTLCRGRRSIGSHVNGAMADYVVVPAKYSFKVPAPAAADSTLETFALTEPLACAVRGVYEKIDFEPGATVVVSGPGIIGQLACQAFKARGARVILSGLPVDREKLATAKRLGAADITVESLDELKNAVYAMAPEGVDITCEAAGAAASLRSCIEVIRPLGTHLQLGLFGGEVPFRLDSMFLKEVTYIPSNSTAVSSWRLTLDLMKAGKFDLTPFVSMRAPLARWREAFQAVMDKKVYKALLIPGGDK